MARRTSTRKAAKKRKTKKAATPRTTGGRATRRAARLDGLRREAVRRFGAARATKLGPVLETTAGQLDEVASFPLDREEGPAFYTGPGER